MRVIPSFEYYRATSLKEALKLLSTVEEPTVIAGGTDLIPAMRDGLEPRSIVDISGVEELKYVKRDDGYIKIGCLTTISTLESSDMIQAYAYSLAEASRLMASIQVRNKATIGGNLCNASPAADTAPPLLTYDAEVVLASASGSRIVKLNRFFEGPKKTCLRKGELLVEVRFKPAGSGVCFMKLGRRTSFTISIVSVAAKVEVEGGRLKNVRIALGSVAPMPVRALRLEEYLEGKTPTPENISRAAKLVLEDISPITDVRSTAEYRKRVSQVLVRDALMRAVKRVREE